MVHIETLYTLYTLVPLKSTVYIVNTVYNVYTTDNVDSMVNIVNNVYIVYTSDNVSIPCFTSFKHILCRCEWTTPIMDQTLLEVRV
jgi:hypothetical protein